MEQKKFEQTQRPKPRRKRYRPLIRRKHLRATGTTAVKKEKGKVKLNEYVLELESKNIALKKCIEELKENQFPSEPICEECGKPRKSLGIMWENHFKPCKKIKQ